MFKVMHCYKSLGVDALSYKIIRNYWVVIQCLVFLLTGYVPVHTLY